MEDVSSVPFPQLKGSALISVLGPAALNTAARGSAGVLIGPLAAMVMVAGCWLRLAFGRGIPEGVTRVITPFRSMQHFLTCALLD